MYKGSTVLGQTALGLQDHDPAVKTAIFLECLVPTLNSEQHSHFALLLLSNIVNIFMETDVQI